MVDPTGEERADLRMAINTVNVMQAVAARVFEPDDRSAIVDDLRFYLKLNQPEPEPVGPGAMRQALGE